MDLDVALSVVWRATVVYLFLLLVVRLLGKRKLGIHTALDLIVTIILADIASQAINGAFTVQHAVLAVLVVAGWHLAGYYLGSRMPALQAWFTPKSAVLVRNGEIVAHALSAERLNEAELWSLLRRYGIETLDEVKVATLESSGQLSVIRQEWARPARKSDLHQFTERGA